METQFENTRWRVLVVDDLPVWADGIQDFASHFHCDVRLATNFSSAVRALAHWQPHLIILDLHMPWDKWEPLPEIGAKYSPTQKSLAFCEQVTSYPQLSHIIIVIASVESQEEHQALAYQAGAHRFFTKGDFNFHHFEDLLHQVQALNHA